jgi:hypothetical protein
MISAAITSGLAAAARRSLSRCFAHRDTTPCVETDGIVRLHATPRHARRSGVSRCVTASLSVLPHVAPENSYRRRGLAGEGRIIRGEGHSQAKNRLGGGAARYVRPADSFLTPLWSPEQAERAERVFRLWRVFRSDRMEEKCSLRRPPALIPADPHAQAPAAELRLGGGAEGVVRQRSPHVPALQALA